MRKTEKNTQEENNTDESDFSENEIPDLKPFEFEPKKNIGDINSSSDDEEEGAKFKVKRIGNSE